MAESFIDSLGAHAVASEKLLEGFRVVASHEGAYQDARKFEFPTPDASGPIYRAAATVLELVHKVSLEIKFQSG